MESTTTTKVGGMSKRTKLVIAGLGIAALISIPIAGTAFAAPGAQVSPGNTSADGQYYCGYNGGYYLNTVSALLGLTPAEIQAELQSGRSLVDIAAANGVSEEQLLDAILSPMTQQMQQMVAAGVLTQAQADQRTEYMTQNIRQAVQTKGLGATGGYGMMGNGGMMGG